MKLKARKELREIGIDGLNEKNKELRMDHFNMRFQAKLGEVNNPLRLRTIRRDIARVATLLREANQKKHLGEIK
jgi:large subunit ribosomal protein L29